MKKNLLLGNTPVQLTVNGVSGEQVSFEGEDFYRIAHYDQLRPFLMSIVSGSDHWMFISSNGALTAGRRNPDLALFPYYTDDKIYDSAEITGGKTILVVQKGGKNSLWEPFSLRYAGIYKIRRNLWKNFTGNKVIFEEINEDLGLAFRYGWFNSERFGFVKKSWLIHLGTGTAKVRLLDGIQNLMPCGIGSQLQLEKSTLVDAYKKNELLPECGLGLFTLSSVPVDRPEPAESLKATIAWSLGLKDSIFLLSTLQLENFRRNEILHPELDVRAERGAYFIHSELVLQRRETKSWCIVADVDRGPSDVAQMSQLLCDPERLEKEVQADIERGTRELRQIVCGADGLQKTALPLGNARHFNNVLFNSMRGGTFCLGYQIDSADLSAYLSSSNKEVAAQHARRLEKLCAGADLSTLISLAVESGDKNLERLCREYLPLTFSRRHGDPSRPWNRFSIASRKADGSRVIEYNGNWRDIFQNWEALSVSFPGYTSNMVSKFVNASTIDGYNPYRISSRGIDWEVIDHADPWSHIGYWGDHQVIYLLALLEKLQSHEPAVLRDFLTRDIFAYANVPYRINSYEQLVKNPKETVVFDDEVEKLVNQRVQMRGSDGKLLWDSKGQVCMVNLTEKLLASLLAKLSNFIPEAGIWLNTQRPEWNDANNALVGSGVSMVTLYYLHRYLDFCRELFRPLLTTDVSLSREVGHFLQSIFGILEEHRPLLAAAISNSNRQRILDRLGRAGCQFRQQVYENGLSGDRVQVKGKGLLNFFDVAVEWIGQSIRANRREDGLYHAYNLVAPGQAREMPIRRLYEMLEGQVAVLSSDSLSAEESLQVLGALKRSALYRADQHSYLLYPDRKLARFTEKNRIPKKAISGSKLLTQLIADNNSQLVEGDVAGHFHFNGAFSNAGDVSRVLRELANSKYAKLVKAEKGLVLDIFEQVFDHQSFTGRSGTFFGYEGLGCIYWHMVSKLLLAAQETFFRAIDAGASRPVLEQLAACYYELRAGIGDHKTPQVYGAFPMDPYSHTPGHGGARQPGLTGQVKEDILCRMGELGVFVRHRQLCFRPQLLRRDEFLSAPEEFRYFDLHGVERVLKLPARSLAFTYCQVPIIYRLATKSSVQLDFEDGSNRNEEGLVLDAMTSRLIFERTGKIVKIQVGLAIEEPMFAMSP